MKLRLYALLQFLSHIRAAGHYVGPPPSQPYLSVEFLESHNRHVLLHRLSSTSHRPVILSRHLPAAPHWQPLHLHSDETRRNDIQDGGRRRYRGGRRRYRGQFGLH